MVLKLWFQVESAVLKSLVQKLIKRVQFHFKQFVLTSTMVLQKQTQLMVRLVLRHGFTRAKYSANLVIREEQIVEKGEESNAFT